jgi:kinesin family protein 4/21/27
LNSTQESIFESSVKDLTISVLDGYNATVLAYGQTGSGKTFTMGSASSIDKDVVNQGIIPRAIMLLFNEIERRFQSDSSNTIKIQAQFIEIYGEDIRDLLDKTKSSAFVIPGSVSKLTLRETTDGDVFVAGAKEETVASATQLMELLERGGKQRSIAATGMNSESSRSHGTFNKSILTPVYKLSTL